MKKTILTLLLALSCTFACAADKVPARPHIEVVTTEGTFKLELDGKAAPLTVANFLHLVESGFYDGTIFHRIIPGFMAQGGGYTPGFKKKAIAETVANESGNGLSNLRGTIAMARTGDPHSASTQFFINHANNAANLDPVKGAARGRVGVRSLRICLRGHGGCRRYRQCRIAIKWSWWCSGTNRTDRNKDNVAHHLHLQMI